MIDIDDNGKVDINDLNKVLTNYDKSVSIVKTLNH